MDSLRITIIVAFQLIWISYGTANDTFVGWDDYWQKWSDDEYRQAGRMYPHGTTYLDTSATTEQRRSGFDPGLTYSMRYFGRIYNSCFISVHGHIALRETSPAPATDFRKGEWPNPEYPAGGQADPAFLGVYYANTNFRVGYSDEPSRIFYRIMHKTSQEDARSRIDNGMLEMFSNDIRVSVLGAADIVAQHALLVTWYRVTFGGAACDTLSPTSDTCYRNTYQMALVVTEDERTFSIINYFNVTWLGSSDMGCDSSTGQFLPGPPPCAPAKAGFNIGEARGFHEIPYSGTQSLLTIDDKGGSNVPGRFFFQVSGARLIRGGCTNDTALGGSTWELEVSPEFSGMFGGKEVNVAGPCFLDSDSIMCRFGDTVSRGVARSGIMSAMCVSPAQARIGDTQLSVSVDGGNNYHFHTNYVIGYMGRLDRRILVTPANGDWLNPDTIQLSWKPEYLGSETDHTEVRMYGYHETPNGQMQLDNLGVLADSVRNTGNYIFSPKDSPCTEVACSTYDLGAIQVKVTGTFTRMYSDVIPLGWFNRVAMEGQYGDNWIHERCRKWNSDDVTDVTWRNSLWPCPCTLDQALADFGRFQPDSYCNMNNMNPTSCKLHNKGAVHCVRSVLITSKGSGSHCCYNSGGELMYSGDDVDGSTPDKAHPWGKPPYGTPPYIPSVSHWASDVIPYYLCCEYQPESDHDCFNYFISLRLTTDCRDYSMPGFAGVFGDPHFRTFDGTTYTFNGHGEFWLLRTDNDVTTTFGIQGRFQQVNYTQWGGARVSVLTAVSIREEGKTTVELRMDQRQQYDKIGVFIDGRLLTFPHYDVSWQDFPDVMIIDHDAIDSPMRTNFTVAYRSGFGVQVAYKNGLLHLTTAIPPQLYNHVRGLLGNWNGSPDDDLQPSNGGQSVPADDLRSVHYNYGWTWATSESESYFRYASRLTHDYYKRENFEPVLTWPPTGLGNCGEDMSCNFDLHNTQDATVAADTLAAHAWLSQLQGLQNDVKQTCGWLHVLNAVRQEPVSYYVGSTVIITGCRHGFTLDGPTTYRCEVMADGSVQWTPDIVTRCIDNTNIQASKERLAMAVGIPAGIVFCILVIALIAAVCHCRKKQRIEKARKAEPYRGDMTANDEFLTDFHNIKGESRRPNADSRPPRPAYHAAATVPVTDDYTSSQGSQINLRSRTGSQDALNDSHDVSKDSIDAFNFSASQKSKKKPRAPYRGPNYPSQPEAGSDDRRRPYQYPKSTQVLTIDELMAINKTDN